MNMDRESALREVKARIPITDYLQKSERGNYCCPFCGSGTGPHRTGAVKIYPESNTFYCHACGKYGDIIDLYQQKINADYNTTVSILAADLGITIDESAQMTHEKARKAALNADKEEKHDETGKTPLNASQSVTDGNADYMAYYEACRDRLTDSAAVEYLQSRGISVETAKRYYIGYDPAADPANAPGGNGETKHPAARIIIPTTRGHYTGRAIDPEIAPAYQKMNAKGSRPGIFNQNALYAQNAHELFVTEGAFDALSIIEAGSNAIALNSANNVNKLLQQIESKPTAATLIICMDNDPDERTREAIAKQKTALESGLRGLNVHFMEADIVGPYKDANERLQHDREGLTAAVHAAAAEANKTEIEAFLEQTYTQKYKGVPTGIKSLDILLNGGFIPQTLILLGGEAGTGKTALATQIFENMAAAGHECIYLNLEMSKEQMLARGLARRVYIKYPNLKLTALNILRGYEQTAETRAKVQETAAEYQESILNRLHYNPDGVSAALDDILSYIDSAATAAVAAGKPAPYICIDYLHIMTGAAGEDAATMLKRAVGKLKEYAAKYNAIVLAIMAHSRAANNSNEVTMSAGRDTSALEYSADLQLALQRKDKENYNEITLQVTKSRFTQTTMNHGINFEVYGGQSYFKESGEWTPADGTPFNRV